MTIKYSLVYFCIFLSFTAATICEAAGVTYYCDYPKYATPDGLQKQKGKFELTFLVNREPEKSYLIGNNGASEIGVVGNRDGGISLVEITATGNIMTTVILESGESVHNRSNIIFGGVSPSQHYGKCTSK